MSTSINNLVSFYTYNEKKSLNFSNLYLFSSKQYIFSWSNTYNTIQATNCVLRSIKKYRKNNNITFYIFTPFWTWYLVWKLWCYLYNVPVSIYINQTNCTMISSRFLHIDFEDQWTRTGIFPGLIFFPYLYEKMFHTSEYSL